MSGEDIIDNAEMSIANAVAHALDSVRKENYGEFSTSRDRDDASNSLSGAPKSLSEGNIRSMELDSIESYVFSVLNYIYCLCCLSEGVRSRLRNNVSMMASMISVRAVGSPRMQRLALRILRKIIGQVDPSIIGKAMNMAIHPKDEFMNRSNSDVIVYLVSIIGQAYHGYNTSNTTSVSETIPCLSNPSGD